jgi:hypothetical protein
LVSLTEHPTRDARPERVRRGGGVEGSGSATPIFPSTCAHFVQTNTTQNGASLVFSDCCAYLQKQWAVYGLFFAHSFTFFAKIGNSFTAVSTTCALFFQNGGGVLSFFFSPLATRHSPLSVQTRKRRRICFSGVQTRRLGVLASGLWSFWGPSWKTVLRVFLLLFSRSNPFLLFVLARFQRTCLHAKR